jgi:hypothetical protein
MKLFVDITGLTHIMLVNKQHCTVYETNITYSELEKELRGIAEAFPNDEIDSVYLSGLSRYRQKSCNYIRELFSNAVIFSNGTEWC